MANKCLSLKAKNYGLRNKSTTSLKKPERSQWHLWGDVFHQFPGRRLRNVFANQPSLGRLKNLSEMHPCQLGTNESVEGNYLFQKTRAHTALKACLNSAVCELSIMFILWTFFILWRFEFHQCFFLCFCYHPKHLYFSTQSYWIMERVT